MMSTSSSLKMYPPFLLQIFLLVVLVSQVISIQPPVMPNLEHLKVKPKIENLNKISLKGKPVPPCIACQSLVKSFLMAVNKTTRQSFEGGDADWERQKLGTYENSELRFIEIQEMLCADVELGKDQCYNLAEQYESELEDWFFENRKKNVDLLEFLCIKHIKVCCPNNTYGPKCVPCPGGIERPCGGHGKCRKGGTREEPASCVCDTGYTGDLCEKCEKGYYSEFGVSALSCKKCNRACKSHCRGPGPLNCEVCADDYYFVPDKGCIAHSEDEEEETDLITKEANNMKKSSETNQSDQVNISSKSTNAEDNEVKLQSNMDDSGANIPHSEL